MWSEDDKAQQEAVNAQKAKEREAQIAVERQKELARRQELARQQELARRNEPQKAD